MPNPIPRATIIGDGAMGTMCALVLAQRGTRVVIWGRSAERVATLNSDRENRQYLPGHSFPDLIDVTDDPAEAFDASQLIVSAVPCQFIRSIWSRLRDHVTSDIPIVSVAKGIEVGTLLHPTAVISDCIGKVPVACLSGPCIAPEVAAGKPTGVVVASEDREVAEFVQEGCSTNYFRVYTSDDLVGVETAAAVKNVIAIAAGICDGIEAGDNAKAALVTRGLVEITRLGVAMGASVDTFRGLAGVGDLVTTCISNVGRNRSAGERIGRGETLAEVEAFSPSIVEGIPTTQSVLELAKRYDVDMPIVSGVASVLFGGQRPCDAIEELMTRPLKSE